MPAETNLKAMTEEFVQRLFKEDLPDWAVYHSFQHTFDIVQSVREIGEGSKLNRSEMEIVELAAWFHDTGYTGGSDGHEERSVDIARKFLSGFSYPADKTEAVARCILATRMPQAPVSLLEQVVCDADMSHLGRKNFFERNDLMRMELERRENRRFTDVEWLDTSTRFVSRHSFFTPWARDEYEKRRTKNLIALQESLREAYADAEVDAARFGRREEERARKEAKASRPERGIETVFRVVPKNHIDLTAMADSKAHMLISTNSIIISLVVGLMIGNIETYPHLLAPVGILLAVNLAAIIFAVLATRPKVTSGKFTRADIEQKKANLLFFGSFHSMSPEEFEWGMTEMMNDREYLYGSMIRDLHALGRVLAVKYRYLRIGFNVFMYGLVAAIVAFIVAVLAAPPAV